MTSKTYALYERKEEDNINCNVARTAQPAFPSSHYGSKNDATFDHVYSLRGWTTNHNALREPARSLRLEKNTLGHLLSFNLFSSASSSSRICVKLKLLAITFTLPTLTVANTGKLLRATTARTRSSLLFTCAEACSTGLQLCCLAFYPNPFIKIQLTNFRQSALTE